MKVRSKARYDGGKTEVNHTRLVPHYHAQFVSVLCIVVSTLRLASCFFFVTVQTNMERASDGPTMMTNATSSIVIVPYNV